MNDGREYDLEQLRQEYKQTRDPGLRKQMEEAARKISKESGLIRSMRERLIKEHRRGNIENIKDIHFYIKDKLKYQNGR